MEPPIPKDEAARIAALTACKILDTPAEESFDDLARVAAQICGAQIALVSLVDSHRQWFKARVNFETAETPRKVSFCAHAVAANDELIVPDTHADERFKDNPLVVSRPRFRFYAGVPLRVDEGSPLGTLCVLDVEPRELSPAQLSALRSLARQISRELVLRSEVERHRAREMTGSVPLAAGDVVGRWKIARPLGEGSMGSVFEAVSDDGKKRGAMKVLRREWAAHEEVVERFSREARTLMQVRDPHVARLLDVGNLDDARDALPFLVLEYLEGTDVDRLIAHRRRISLDDTVKWCRDACTGLAAAHDRGIVHRDLKPSNIFLARQADGSELVKVIDFGIATAPTTDPKLTREGAPIGTALYMAPEQMVCSPALDQRADVWSMGVVLYEMLTGRMPFTGSTQMEIFASVLTRPPLPLREGPEWMARVIRRCLSKEPADRYPNIRALRDSLLV
jgi:hypothetical protein